MTMCTTILVLACLPLSGHALGASAQDDEVEDLARLLLAINPSPMRARRNALAHGAAWLTSLAATAPAFAEFLDARPRVGAGFNDIRDEDVPPSQKAPSGKIDVNNAYVTDYMQFPGMYPRAAGLIASNGPYRTVKDLYDLEAATEQDKKMFQKYASNFVALPPGRMFVERINARQSV